MKDKRELAVKKLNVVNDNQAEDARDEILALMNCQGPHVLRYKIQCSRDIYIYILLIVLYPTKTT